MTTMLSSIYEVLLWGVPRDVGASDEDRVLGARDEERDEEGQCELMVLEVPVRIRGGRSRADGGDIDRLLFP
jgi:hypothetical protein